MGVLKEGFKQITKPTGRVYVKGDKEYNSVTTVLKILSAPAIDIWIARIGEEEARKISTKAANFGTQVHKYGEDIANGKSVKAGGRGRLKERYQQCIDNFHKWMDKYVDKILFTEKTLFSDEYLVAGTADIGALLRDGKTAIIDIKTGKTRLQAALQMAAYREMYREELAGDKNNEDCYNAQIDRQILSIRHDRKNPKVIECIRQKSVDKNFDHDKKCTCMQDTHEQDREVFLSCLNLWRWMR